MPIFRGIQNMTQVTAGGVNTVVVPPREIRIFSTCPESIGHSSSDYLARIVDVANWSEAAGCAGILIYTDNGLVDPWALAQIIVQSTKTLVPLVAVQPIYMHPYWVAKQVATLAYLHHRPIALNMVAGGFRNDLLALGDRTAHDHRYDRLSEYTLIIQELLRGQCVTLHGEFYDVDKLTLKPALPPELFPQFMSSGSSEAGLAAAQRLNATAVQYLGPPEEFRPPTGKADWGARVGIIAREDSDDAWRIAHERFPRSRRGELTHQLAMKVSDSHWRQDLSARPAGDERSAYWLGPFQQSQTNCPYLVGAYSRVAEELSGYMARGVRTYILDIPPDREELSHISVVFRQAQEMAL